MSNYWWEIAVECDRAQEESVYWQLDNFGCSGTATSIDNDLCTVKAYIPDVVLQSRDLSSLKSQIEKDATVLEVESPEMSWNKIEEEDWAVNWKKDWQPQEIGDRFLIYPAWLAIPDVNEESSRLLLRLDPGVAFGTGAHPTTQLCLESLEMRLSEGASDLAIADIGCGSGILSIGALLLGAKEVTAVDTDPLAVKASLSNAELNDIERQRLTIKQGSTAEAIALQKTYDGVLCNILADIIIQIFPHFNSFTHDKSWAILSGILLSQADDIADVVESNGWTIAALWKRGEWCCFNIRRSQY